jgi:Periplasmic copper-binding protein (NosD)
MKVASIFALTVLAAVPVLAQNDISWVSQRTGFDNFSCGPIASPCKTFLWAALNTNNGGTIKALDAGEYGHVTIGQSIIIDGNGVGASIEASSAFGNAVSFIARNVEIRNLTIHVSPSCVCDGIVTSHDVHVENVTINGSPRWGVVVANKVTATIHGLRVTNAGGGIYVSGGTATITDSLVRGSFYGIFAEGTTAAAQVLIQGSKLISNGTGLLVENNGSAATARISGNVIAGNTTGISTSGGTSLPGQIITFRDNAWAGNGADGTTPFSVSLK